MQNEENITFNFIATQDDIGKRLDLFLVNNLQAMTRSRIQQLLVENCVAVNEKQVSKSCRINAGDNIQIIIPQIKSIEILPQDLPLDIIYEDDALLVVNKAKGMVVHPAAGNPDGTLVNALLYHCKDGLSGINGEIRPGIVHRIDKDTSGLLVVAKTNEAHLFLSEQMAVHSITREYIAVVYGNLKQDEGCIDAPIGRHLIDRKKMAVNHKNGKPAITHYTVLQRFNGFTQIKCRLETGRTHQIRVHMASIGHPLAGDTVYGPKKAITNLNGQCLHAAKLGFIHPATKQYMQFESPLPNYFVSFLQTLKGTCQR